MKAVLAVRLGAILALVLTACEQTEPKVVRSSLDAEVSYVKDGGLCFALVEAKAYGFKYPRFGVVLIPCDKIPINASR